MIDVKSQRATSTTPEGPFQFQDIILPYHNSTGATQYWDRSAMNPKV